MPLSLKNWVSGAKRSAQDNIKAAMGVAFKRL